MRTCLVCLALALALPAPLLAEEIAPPPEVIERARIDDPVEHPDVVAEPVTITHRVMEVGTIEVEDMTSTMTLNLELKTGAGTSQPMAMAQTRREARETEVLEASADAPTQVRVTYQRHVDETTMNGAVETTVDAVDGKTYHVTATGERGAATVTYEDGSAPSAEEIESVRGDHARLGEPEPLAAAIPSGELEPGQTIDVPLDVLAGLFDSGVGIELTAISLTYVGTLDAGRHTLAAFDMALRFGGEPEGMKLTGSLRGRMYLLPERAWEADYDLRGPVDIDSDKTDTRIVGRGEMRVRSTTDFTTPRADTEED